MNLRNNITNVKTIYENQLKAVYTANSTEFGPVLIKVDSDIQQIKTEYEMLLELNGRRACKAYFFDENRGMLIEERIIPGTVLRQEKSLAKRLDAFARVFNEIHFVANEGKTYLDWLISIVNYCETKKLSEYWIEKSKLAYELCLELFEKYDERLLLHGDLHHDNILQRCDGSYAMIDPKGIIGPQILDLPRFILNEIDTEYRCAATKHIENVIAKISQKMEFPAKDVAKAFVMEAIMANVWFIEDNMEINATQMEVAEHILKKYEMEKTDERRMFDL